MPPTPSTLHRAFSQLSQSWPVDKLRPTLQFSGAIQSAANRIFGSPTSSTTTPIQLSPFQLDKATQSVQALERLLEGNASKKYPMTNKTLVPASFPKHYSRMREGIARAERGEVRAQTWGEVFNFRWK